MSGVSYSPATPSASSPIHRLALAVVTAPERAAGAFMSAPSGAREDAMRNLLQTADLIVRSALHRHESRGLHYTLDYPEQLPTSGPSVLSPLVHIKR